MVNINYNKQNNKHKRYFLADAAYDTNDIKESVKNINITPIIWRVRRGNYQKFNKHETDIYRKRIIIENCFSWLFKCRRTNRRLDKKTCNYMSFVFAAFCRLIIGRI